MPKIAKEEKVEEKKVAKVETKEKGATFADSEIKAEVKESQKQKKKSDVKKEIKPKRKPLLKSN